MSTTVEYILDVETQKAQTGLKKTEVQTKRTTDAVKNARKQFRGMSGTFQAVGEVSNIVNPQLAGLADVAIQTSSAFRALGRSLASGNPIIIGITAALMAGIAVYSAYTASVRANEESIKKLNETLEKNTAEIEKNQQAFTNAENAILDSAGGINELRLKYAELSGEINKGEALEARQFFAAEQGAQKLRDELDKQIQTREKDLELAKASAKAIKERLTHLSNSNRLVKFGGGATKEAADEYVKENKVLSQIAEIERELLSLRTDGVKRIEAQSKEFSDLQDKIAKLLKKQQQREEAIKRAKERQTQLQRLLNDLQNQSATLAAKVRDSEIARMAPLAQINAQYQKEIDGLNAIEAGIIRQFEEAERVAKSKRDQALLTDIQKAKTEALAQVEAARGDAEAKRAHRLGNIYGKNIKTQIKGLANIGKAFGQTLGKQIQAQNQVSKIINDANSDQLTAIDKINEAEQERLRVLQEIAKQQKINTDEAQRAVEARAQRDRARVRQQQAASIAGGVETVVRASIDPTALIGAIGSAFGPIGGAVAGVVSALSDLGQKDPEEIKEEFRATFEGIAKGLKVVIPLIFEMLPPILFDAAKMIINALIQLPVTLASHISKAIGHVLKGIVDFFKDPIGNIVKGIGQLFQNFIDLIVEAFTSVFPSFMGGGRMPSAQGGIRFTGASRGLAMLHEGEAVIPRSGQISSSVARDAQNIIQAQGGGGVTVVINSAITERSAVDALVRKIEERFSAFGQSTSPLFGGR